MNENGAAAVADGLGEDDLGSIRQMYNELGIGAVGAIEQASRYGWGEPLLFDTAIAASGSGESTRQISNEYAFCVQTLGISIWNPSAFATNVVAGTPAYTESNGQTGANIQAYMARRMFRLQIRTGSLDWWAKPVNVELVAGTITRPGILPTRRWVAPGASMIATLYNDTGDGPNLSVKAHLLLEGVRVRIRGRR